MRLLLLNLQIIKHNPNLPFYKLSDEKYKEIINSKMLVGGPCVKKNGYLPIKFVIKKRCLLEILIS